MEKREAWDYSLLLTPRNCLLWLSLNTCLHASLYAKFGLVYKQNHDNSGLFKVFLPYQVCVLFFTCMHKPVQSKNVV